ncbi:MAG: phosphoglycerate dehydrogenase, partial [Pseudomonadota bacterium]
IQIKGINLEAEPMPHMLYTTNADVPGYIGALGTKLGALSINIATFALGRREKDGEAIALLGVDDTIPTEDLEEIAALPQVTQAKSLNFQG